MLEQNGLCFANDIFEYVLWNANVGNLIQTYTGFCSMNNMSLHNALVKVSSMNKVLKELIKVPILHLFHSV